LKENDIITNFNGTEVKQRRRSGQISEREQGQTFYQFENKKSWQSTKRGSKNARKLKTADL
jgi:hypothetical protein